MASIRNGILACIALSCLLGCAPPQIHIHDRHGLSYPLVERFAKAHPGSTLVLLDYHHDIGPMENGVTSANWAGVLLEKGLLAKVVWVSGRDLLLPNRNSRIKWLRRCLRGFGPSEASRIEERVTLLDWSELRNLRPRAPLIVSLDLDILCHDPGDPPERFLDELIGWIAERRPRLVTVALSAAYQREAPLAWSALERFALDFPDKTSSWYLEAGSQAPNAEGGEERAAWQLWSGFPDSFGRYGEGFWPGAGIWVCAPQALRASLTRRGIRAGDETAAAVISGWSDPDRAALEREFPEAGLGSLAAAADSLESAWRGGKLPEPPPGRRDLGIALRVLNKGLDRGCLALYEGVTDPEAAIRYCAQRAAGDPRYVPVAPVERPDLDLEISVFGPWREMSGPLDFRPGCDSVLLCDMGRTTLLQASLAVERRYDREAFLRVLSRKAGLGEEGWKRPGLGFRRAVTIWYRRSLTSIEEGSPPVPAPRKR
jgi:AMMECR1 domain-containing protein